MSQIQIEIARIYPSFLGALSSRIDELSESRLMAELASHVVDLFETGNVVEIHPAFELIERLLVTGSEAEKHAAIVGFLETVQNVASHRVFGSVAFEQFLGPSSQKAWAEMNNQWKGKTSLAEVVASETGATLERPWWQFWRRRKRRSPRELLNQIENPELRKIVEQITRE